MFFMITRFLIMIIIAVSATATLICAMRRIPSAVWVKNLSIISSLLTTSICLYVWNFNNIITYDLFNSLLLWLFLHSIIGVVLTFKRTTAAALSFYFAMQSGLSILLLICTFDTTKNLDTLNILQLHMIDLYLPLILFSCSVLAVPLSLALGNLIDTPASLNFLEAAQRWTIAACLFLSVALFIGFYWLYSVFGFSNSNLNLIILSPILPLLMCILQMHLINLSNFKTTFLPFTYAIMIFSYSTVLCGTFLVRIYISSGMSMHADNAIIIIAISIANVILLVGSLFLLTSKSKNLSAAVATEPLRMNVGGIIAHIGLLIALCAAAFSLQSETLIYEFVPNVDVDLFGRNVIYEGQVQVDSDIKSYVYTVDGVTIRASESFNLCRPAILRTFYADFCIAPAPSENLPVKELVLQHDKFTLDSDLGFIYKSVEYVTNSVDEPIGIKVRITITDGDDVQILEPTQFFDEASSDTLNFFNKRLRLTGISDDESNIKVEILPSLDDIAGLPVSAAVSVVPFMWLFWLSFIFITAGISVTFIQHF